MIFSSIIFLCFFLPVMIIGYYILPKKLRNLFLLLGSLFFYAWGEPRYLLIMLVSFLGNYCFGLLVDFTLRQRDGQMTRQKRLGKFLIAGTVLFNLGILFYFKYYVFAIETISNITGRDMILPEIVLPIGISFYTFKGISYVIDVYRESLKQDENGNQQSLVQKNPIDLALYITMFPQLMAGPIERYGNMRESLKNRTTSFRSFSKGMERFIIGLAKKVILADSIGIVADTIFASDYSMLGTGTAWLGIICYTLQIYYDFSGYSDMAIGLGRIFGFSFCENFNYPYISKSITEFWRRWHISLSSWFRDYLYIPLGGNRKGKVRTYVNLLLVFLATGIWHGAAWGFFIWGLWHGLFMVIERLLHTKKIPRLIHNEKIHAVFCRIYTMLVVMLGWVLFKTIILEDALNYIGVMFHMHTPSYVAVSARYYLDNKLLFMLTVAVLAAIPWKELIPGKVGDMMRSVEQDETINLFFVVRRVVLLLLLVISMMFVMNSTYNPFIYFKF